MSARILVIDDEIAVCISCKRILEEEGYEVVHTTSATKGLELAINEDFDAVLLDLKMPDMPGMEVLTNIKRHKPEIYVIIITGYATIKTSIEAIKKGAFDYVPKPFTPEELAISVAKALKEKQLKDENQYLKKEIERLKGSSTGAIGRSKVFEELMMQVAKIAPTDFTVMIYGESGSGKEVIARAVHNGSHRADGPFVAVDISALTPTLVESELFGHVKGAFTGADHSRPGYFLMANGGTLFLDEISNISFEMQGKLLRVLESRRVRPVGSEEEHEIDVRIIAATNKDLKQMVDAGEFREDLYYRLNVIPLLVPPLRERSDDIPILAMHFLKQAAAETGKHIEGFSTEAMAKLVSFDWPGNIRQLKNIIDRIVATADGPVIGIEHLPEEICSSNSPHADMQLTNIPQTAEELKQMKRQIKEQVFAEIEKQFLIDALNRSGWNVTRAAKLVGMQRPNFHALMRKYGIRIR